MNALLKHAAVLALATTTALVLGAAGHARNHHTNAAPSALVGKWGRTISKADATRSGGLLLAAGKHVTMTIAKNGNTHVVVAGLGGLGDVEAAIAAAGNGQLRFTNSGEPPSLYRWRVAGNTLTLTKIKDTVPDRQTVLRGVWKRAG